MTHATLRLSFLLSIFCVCLATTVQASPPLATTPNFERDAYVGRWHQIAFLPNWFQRKCVGETTADYAALPDGSIAVTNQCRTADGIARAIGVARQHRAHPADPAILQVRFAPAWLSALPFVWGDYWVIATEGHYDAALVGSPDRRYLWILARQPTLPDDVYRRLVGIANAQGFDVAALKRE